MKRHLLFKSLLLLCALIVGTNAWAVEQVYYTLATTTAGTNNSYAGTCDVEVNNITWNVQGNSQQTPWRIGGKKLTTATNRIVYSKTKMDEVITKVIFSFGSNSSTFASQITVNSVKLTISTAANGGGTVIDEVTKTSGFGASQSLTFTPSAGKEWSEDSYYTFTFNITTDNVNSNRFFEFSQAVFYHDVASSATLDNITLSGTYPTEFYVGDAFSHEGMTVTAHYSDASSLDVTSSATFSGYNMSTAGDQTVTVSYEESSVEKTTTYDITVSPVPSVVLTLDFATNILGLPVGSSNKETGSTGYSYGGYTYTLAAPDGFYYLEATNPSSYKCLLMGKSGATLTFPAFPFKVKMIKVYGTPGASGSVTQNIFVGDAAISTETTGAKDVTNVYSIPSAYQAIGTVYVLKVTSSANTQISKIEILGDGEAVAVSAVGLATFASDNKLDFTNVPDLEAYIAKESAGVITLEQVNKVDAGTGVLLRALNGTTAFGVPVTTADADDATGNKFVRGNDAAVATSEGGNYNWILSKKGEVIGFYHANGNTVASNRAYLQTTTASARILLDFDDVDVTAIENVEVQKADSQYFNLAGQRVANPTKGLYIVNGKKVVIK